jgi:hypothetical protein
LEGKSIDPFPGRDGFTPSTVKIGGIPCVALTSYAGQENRLYREGSQAIPLAVGIFLEESAFLATA